MIMALITAFNHWSNPEVSYNGIPTGVDYQAANSADNVMALNQTAAGW